MKINYLNIFKIRPARKFAVLMLVSFSVFVCFTLTSAWGTDKGSLIKNQIAEASTTSNTGIDDWGLRDYPRTKTFLDGLTTNYYGKKIEGTETEETNRKELKATRQNLAAVGSGARDTKIGTYGEDNKPFIKLQTRDDIDTECGLTVAKDQSISSTNLYMVLNSDLMPTDNIFSTTNFLQVKPDDLSDPNGTHIASLYFNDAGKVDGENVDMIFRINQINVKARTTTNNRNKYAKYAKNQDNVGLVFGRISQKSIWENYIKGGGNPPQISGSISLTSDNLVWYNAGPDAEKETHDNFWLQVEVDYTIAIVDKKTEKPAPYQYPVYTLYSDLDVTGQGGSITTGYDSRTYSNEYDKSGNYLEYNGIKCMFDESITPYENTYKYAYRFAPQKDTTKDYYSPFELYMSKDQAVRADAPTFKATPNKINDPKDMKDKVPSDYSGGYPDSWFNTGAIITSDPSSGSGAYSASWRGMLCETGISLSPCPSYVSKKSVEKHTGHTLNADQAYVENPSSTEVKQSDTLDADGYYTFNVDFGEINGQGSGTYGTDLFYLPDSLKFIDYLPAGLELIDGEDLQAAIKNENIKLVRAYKNGTKPDDEIPIGKDSEGKYLIEMTPITEGGKVVSNKITVSVDSAYLTDKTGDTHFNGSTWRMKLKARPRGLTEGSTAGFPAGYATGEVAQYPGTSTNMWKYQNVGAINSEGYEFKSHPVDIYTPLFGHDYTFYQMNADGTKTETPVPEIVTTTAKPDALTNTYKVGETVSLTKILKSDKPVPKATSVRDTDGNLWLFTEWKDLSLTVPYPTTSNGEQDLNFIGYWKKINKPTEIKEYNAEKKTEGYITDSSTVQLNDKIAYELIATNDKYPTSAQISFTDVPSVGLTFDPNSVIVTKELNGTTSTLTAGKDFVFANNLINNKGDGTNSITWSFDSTHTVEYTAKIRITYSNSVNIDAMTKDDVNNKCTIIVGTTSTVYSLTNPVVKQITSTLDGKKEWSDLIPVNIKEGDYKVSVSKKSFNPSDGADDTNFSRTYNITPYDISGDWLGTWSTGNVIFYLPGQYTFNVNEVNTSKGGVTYDITSFEVTYTVIRNTDNTLSVTKAIKKGTESTTEIKFINTYYTSVEIPGAITKTITSTGTVIPEAKTFNFEATFLPSAGITPTTHKASITTTKTDKTTDSYSAKFDNVTFTKPGSYTITYKETTASENGWTTDTATPSEVITVTDNGNGTLTANPASFGTSISFINTYNPTEAKFNIPVKKQTRAAEGSQVPTANQTWTFTLASDTGSPLPTITTKTVNTNRANPDAEELFNEISYPSTGIYKYTITETPVTKWSVEPTTAKYDLFIKVEDDSAQGKLVASGPYSDQECTGAVFTPTFTNTLTPTPTTATIPAYKIMNCDLPEGFESDFEANITYESSNTPDPEVSATYVKITQEKAKTKTSFTNGTTQGFGNVEFIKPGIYTYTVKETKDTQANINYDESIFTIKFTVVQNSTDETILEVSDTEIKKDNKGTITSVTEILFENEFTPVPPEHKKDYDISKVNGYITDNSAVQIGDKIAYKLTCVNDEHYPSSVINFSDIPSVGLTFNPDSVKITKEHNGKTVELKENDDYTFTNNLASKGNKGDGSSTLIWDFGNAHPVEYSAKITITYYDTVNIDAATHDEVNNTSTIKLNNNPYITILTNPVVKQITEKQDGNKAWDDLVPTNIKVGDYQINVTKESFSPEEGIKADNFEGTYNVATYDSAGKWDGSWQTGDVIFYLPGTYKFKVKEINTSKGGVTYDSSQYTLTYNVTRQTSESGKIILVSEKTITKDSTEYSSITFTNKYETQVSVNGKITKFVKSVGSTIPANKEFFFKVTIDPILGVYPIEATSSIKTQESAKTQDEYSTSIGEFTFYRPGTYTATFEETSSSGDGWTTDNGKPTQTITVTDNGDGTMTANPDTLGTNISFTNTYNPDVVSFNMPITKLAKADEGSYVPIATQTWTFTISADAGTPMPTNATTTIKTNLATPYLDGKFDPITYTNTGIYKYTVTETQIDKWTIEPTSAKYDLFVNVTDDGSGKLRASGPYSDKECSVLVEHPTFTNTLTPTPVSLQIPAYKIMPCDLPKGFTADFEATITPESDSPIPEYSTTKTQVSLGKTKYTFKNISGTEGFGKITFTKPGTYTYKVSEVNNKQLGISYDDSSFYIDFTVEQNPDEETSLIVSKTQYRRQTKESAEVASELLFENMYSTLPVTNNIDGNKWFYEKPDKTMGVDFNDEDFIVNVNPDSNNPEGCSFGKEEQQFSIKNVNPKQTGKGYWTTDQIEFSKVGTYKFKVTEQNTQKYAVEYSKDYYDVVFDVTDNLQGQLVATKHVYKNGGSTSEPSLQINFENDLIPEPIKIYTNPSEMSQQTILNTGDTVSYTLKWTNRQNTDAEIVVIDIPSAGLTFNDNAYDENNKKIAPTENNLINNLGDGHSTIQWNLGKKEAGAIGTITYTATVNEYVTSYNTVNNDYYLKVGDNPATKINQLINPYNPPNPPENIDPMQSSSTSDNCLIIFSIICIFIALSIITFKKLQNK